MNASVIIATANRAAELRDTLENLARIHRPGAVELIVVDNCSTDDTRQVVDHAAAWYPFPVRYLFEIKHVQSVRRIFDQLGLLSRSAGYS